MKTPKKEERGRGLGTRQSAVSSSSPARALAPEYSGARALRLRLRLQNLRAPHSPTASRDSPPAPFGSHTVGRTVAPAKIEKNAQDSGHCAMLIKAKNNNNI